MNIDILSISGYDPSDPEIIAAGEDFDEFADFITELYRARKAQGITQKQVAKSMGTKQSVVSQIERIGGNPTIRTLLSYSRAVGMRMRLAAEPEMSVNALTADVLEDASLLATAQRLTGLTDHSVLIDAALRALVERESAQRLARLGGTRPDAVGVDRRRPSRTG